MERLARGFGSGRFRAVLALLIGLAVSVAASGLLRLEFDDNHRKFFPAEEKEMYLSGAPLHVLAMNLVGQFRERFGESALSVQNKSVMATNQAVLGSQLDRLQRRRRPQIVDGVAASGQERGEELAEESRAVARIVSSGLHFLEHDRTRDLQGSVHGLEAA